MASVARIFRMSRPSIIACRRSYSVTIPTSVCDVHRMSACSLTMPVSLRPFSTTGTAPNPLIMSEAITSPFALRRTYCTSFSITRLTVMESKSLTFTGPFFFFFSLPLMWKHPVIPPSQRCILTGAIYPSLVMVAAAKRLNTPFGLRNVSLHLSGN